MKKISFSLAILFSLILLNACVTKRKKGDAPFLTKAFHNMTAHYNGYFNANVLLTEGIAKLNEQHQDNYTRILDLFPYSEVENPQSVAKEMDEAVKKVSIDASLHRISYWVDDCYLLMGQAQYLKHDFESAEETFSYMRENFDPAKDKTPYVRKAKKKIVEEKKKEKEETKKEKEKTKKEEKKEKEKELKANAKSKKKAAEAKKKAKAQEKKKPKSEQSAVTESTATVKTTATKKSKKPDTPTNIEDELRKREKKESYFLKHRPCHQEGLVWLARTFIERKKYDSAESILRELDKSPRTFDDIRAQAATVMAFSKLKQHSYTDAIEPLIKAVSLSKDKKEKARLAYILAQIYDELNRNGEALAAYEKVLKFRPDYRMEFNARLNITQSGYLNGSVSSADALKNLDRMLKDSKNDEFKDAIYFTIAQIQLKDNNRPAAIVALRQSLINSKGNKAQQAEAYLMLARLYYQGESYVNSKNYYDSTLLVISKTDERHPEVIRYAANLVDIAKNIEIIALQDSLLRIAGLDIKGKRDLATKIRKTAEDEDKKRTAALALAAKAGKGGTASLGDFGEAAKKSSFFAYNEKVVKQGKRDFEKKWGANRKQEDNWRRSNKKSEIIETSEDKGAAAAAINSGEITDNEIAAIFKDVPSSPERAAAANDKILEALTTLGKLYRDKLENNNKCTMTLEEALRRYPENKHELDSWYYLYMAFTDLGNRSKTQEYYDKIVKKYPNTTYGRILTDPSYASATKKEAKELQDFYDATYSMFQERKYADVVNKVEEADTKFGAKNTLKARFALLKAMSLGNTKGKEIYVVALKELITKFPDSAEQKRAKEILRLLGDTTLPAEAKKIQEPENIANYVVEDDKVHYIMVVLKNKNAETDACKNSIADYNRKYNQLDALKVSNVFLGSDTETPLIVIRKFDTKEAAMRYFDGVTKNAKDFLPKKEQYELFAVTQNNYREVLKAKNLEEYRTFFEKNYSK